MRNNKLELPLLKEYATFIQNNLLQEFIDDVSNNYKNLDVPFLKLIMAKEEELPTIVIQSFKDLLASFAAGKALEASRLSIENWKGNKIPGVSRELVTASDLVLVSNARKTSLLKFISKFIAPGKDIFPLLKEIEDYYTFHTELAIQAFTEIKQQDVLLRESRFKDAQALAKVGTWEYNTVTNEIIWSEELYKIYQINSDRPMTVEEVVKHILPEDFPKVQQSVRGAAKSGGTYTIEYQIKRANGSIVTLLENGYSERNTENELIYRGTVQDITFIKKIENELRESEKNFRLLAENSTDIISKHALDSTILYISPSALPITGYRPDELIGKRALEFYHPDDIPDMEGKYEEVTQIPSSHLVNFRFRKKDGMYIWFESIGKTIKDEHGSPLEIIATNRDVTARKESELKLKKSEELLSGILNNSISGFQLFKSVRSEEGKIIDFEWILANNSALTRTGLRKEQVPGKRLLSLFPSVVESGLFDKYVRAAEGETQAFKHNYKGEGLDYWFDIFAQKFEDGFLLSTDDITGQVKAEEELKKSNQELEEKVKLRTAQLEKQKEDIYAVLMQAPAMIAITRGDEFTFELANPFYLKTVGRTKEIIGKPFLEVFPEFKGQPIYEILKKVYETGERYIGTEVLVPVDVNQDGITENLYFNFVYEPLRNSKGIVDGTLRHAVEVTSQVEAKMRLQESEDRFRSMADNIPNLAWMARSDGEIFWFNKRWYEYTGTTPKQMLGFGWKTVHEPTLLDKTTEVYSNAIKSGEPASMVFPIKGTDGLFRPFLSKIVPVKDDQGNITRWFGTNTDISEQIEAEENLEKKNKELLKINNDLDNFIYTASHDLKAPVANIEGLLHAMEDNLNDLSVKNDDLQNILGLIKNSIDRFKLTILDLTEVSKAQKLSPEDVEEIICQEVIDDVQLNISNMIRESGAYILIDTSKGRTIRFSRKNFHSIVYNLLSNAIKYRDPLKQLKIDISIENEEEHTILTVRDNGLGISDSNKAKLFSMFKRFHNHVEGSGIGLYIVKRIIDNAGGHIEVESKVGEGTTFKIFLK